VGGERQERGRALVQALGGVVVPGLALDRISQTGPFWGGRTSDNKSVSTRARAVGTVAALRDARRRCPGEEGRSDQE
jgi:hypothetical protein